MSNIQNLTASLDLKQNLNIYANCKQFDNLNLILLVYDNSIQADLSNYNVRLVAMKADKIPLIQEHAGITINNNVVTIAADEQLTTTSGRTLIELQFTNNSTGQRKATFNLALMVNPSTVNINGSISTATYTLLEELENKLDQLTDFYSNIEEATNLNESLQTQNTNATSNISILNTQNTNATQNISDLESQNNSASTNIPSLTSLNTQAEANIEVMESFGDVTQLAQDVTNLKTEITTARGTYANLDTRLDNQDTQLLENTQDILLRPAMTTASIVYYVNTSTGNDSNNGLTSTTAFKTIQHAINILPQIINNSVTINIADGTYIEDVTVKGFGGKGSIYLTGNIITPANCVIKTIDIENCYLGITIKGFKDSSTTGGLQLIHPYNCIDINIDTCILTTNDSTAYGMIASNSNVNISNCTISNKYSAITGYRNSKIFSSNNSGSGNVIGLNSAANSSIGKSGTQPIGTTAESSTGGGVIR